MECLELESEVRSLERSLDALDATVSSIKSSQGVFSSMWRRCSEDDPSAALSFPSNVINNSLTETTSAAVASSAAEIAALTTDCKVLRHKLSSAECLLSHQAAELQALKEKTSSLSASAAYALDAKVLAETELEEGKEALRSLSARLSNLALTVGALQAGNTERGEETMK